MADGASLQSPRRERLLQAVVDEVARSGYQATTIAQITASARVSRTTFYEHFTDKQDCFLVAYRELAERLLETIEEVLDRTPGANGAYAVLGVLVQLAEHEPPTAVVLTHAATAAGLPALDERNRLLARIEHAVERVWGADSKQAPVPNLPARALVGAAVRELAVRLHRGEPSTELLSELIRWAERYTQSTAASWEPGSQPQTPAPGSIARLPSTTRATRRRARLSPRERIVRAVAELARRDGYQHVTVARIATGAGVNRETFYQHFADKQSAYVAAIQLVFERAMAATAGAYFGRPDWTERVWNGAQGLVEFLARERAIAHIALAEPYAVAGDAVELTIDLQFAFTLFLEEGYRCRPGAEQTPRLTSKLIVAATLELLDRQLRERPEDGLAALAPEIAYLTLAPFIGADAAGEFVKRKLKETRISEIA
jgi:AcrR family transcriptional regulator